MDADGQTRGATTYPRYMWHNQTRSPRVTHGAAVIGQGDEQGGQAQGGQDRRDGSGEMERILTQHVERFLGGMFRQIRRTIWRVLRTGLIAFVLWVVAGGVVLTLLILGLGAAPLAPLALVSYASVGLAGLAVAVAAMAVHVCVAALRGIERAARDAIEEVGRLEGNLARTVSSTISPRPPGEASPSGQ